MSSKKNKKKQFTSSHTIDVNISIRKPKKKRRKEEQAGFYV
jgi:hypothetical protein